MWIARNTNGRLYLFAEKPHRNALFGWVISSDEVIELDKHTFQEITSDKSEPTEVTIVIK